MSYERIFVLIVMILQVNCQQWVAKFKVLHEAIIDCPDKGTNEIQLNWRLNRVNKSLQVMEGPIHFYRDFDDSLDVHAKLWAWQNGGWKAGTGLDFRKSQGCSTFTLVLGQVWKQITKIAHMPSSCPYKKGSWNMTNLNSRAWDNLALPGAPLNKYKLEFSFVSKDDTIRGCYSSIFRVAKK
ncbi:Hypothetical protein NTJ_10595 [Nesidiocoris tenuis]|uniref:MD-2-related lipid-recognition domain-containing protein n=1 Tax=Nesidiocoris tenuis TaxID=355587 RepID=A0ABN7B038_9HEMI|nr:Hypothetical protein NTJ_10595 [Nesidiocoris tenuis]